MMSGSSPKLFKKSYCDEALQKNICDEACFKGSVNLENF